MKQVINRAINQVFQTLDRAGSHWGDDGKIYWNTPDGEYHKSITPKTPEEVEKSWNGKRPFPLP